MTRDELDHLPPMLDVPAAARVLCIGRTLAYELVRTNRWPTPVLRVGKLIKIPSAPLLKLIDDGGADHQRESA
ncbi:MAG TPA: DNA-binding protein [Actinomycetes bacterium]|nr:DNA-binding protein [Actinomycetes bacterium]